MSCKPCTKCKKTKKLNEFGRDKRNRDGHKSWCKACEAERERVYRVANPEKLREQKPYYNTWKGIKKRCYMPSHVAFKHYGGRGIQLHDAWINNYNAFAAYVDNLPRNMPGKLSLDRIDVNGNYEPGNLRWANILMQRLNQRVALNIEEQITTLELRLEELRSQQENEQ